jgi:hypothetical protein
MLQSTFTAWALWEIDFEHAPVSRVLFDDPMIRR